METTREDQQLLPILPSEYKGKIIYTLAMKVKELVQAAQVGVAKPEDILSEADCLLQAAQQVWFSLEERREDEK